MARMSSYHVKVAAEAFAAGLFAQAGYDVSVQYGADQPEYDLVVAKGDAIKKVSVKGSQTGSWGLGQGFLKGANYSKAISQWLSRHGRNTLMCFVQFKGTELGQCPRVYLARPRDVARKLRRSAGGRGGTILREDHTWSARAVAAGRREKIPDSWRFSHERAAQLIG